MRLNPGDASRVRRSDFLSVVILSASALVLGSCAGCQDDALHDISCHPGAPAQGDYDPELAERCDNRIDDNCDGRINEGCACIDGETFTCGSDVGECASTTVTCVGGRFPGCVPASQPTVETCNGLDDDCDGEPDDGIAPTSCYDGPASAVMDGTTPCRTGLSFCEGGTMTGCLGQVLPQQERCDLVDNDCNGAVDDDPVTDGMTCGPDTSAGACAYGTETCVQGESVCLGATYAQAEDCDGVDDDCDGITDEDLWRPCQTACGQGIERCEWGGWVLCSAPVPQPEVCDGLDNDCDGNADEGCPCVAGQAQTCTENMVDDAGEPVSCGIGVQICDLNGQWGQCRQFGTEPEKCDAWDNDCDGAVDGIVRACGDALTAGIGVCVLGTETCEDGLWGACEGAIAPQREVCNGDDDDCDGLTDEDLDPHDKVDMVFAVDVSGSMCPYIEALAQGIGEYVQDFMGTEHRFALVIFPGDLWLDLPYELRMPLSDAATFQASLAALGCDGGGLEPSYDVLAALLDSSDPVGIGWRPDAYPYVVLMGDEEAQTVAGSPETEQTVAARAVPCLLPGCAPGDAVETFGLISMAFASEYDEITYFEPERLIAIDPPDHGRYAQILRDIFADVCLP